ncbi:MAG TPA: hypothetical protein VGO68_03360 [Pyrinomonadaceae bacterium]|jgi:hypothetical protein|nr:hypothetical protein [Pyrinomonadaceae bacterium]
MVTLSHSPSAVALQETLMLVLEPSAVISSSLKSSWLHLDEKTVMNRIDDLKSNPNLIDQGALGLCGEAAFYHHVLQRRPILFGSMAKILFTDSWGFIGNLTIHPDPDLLNANYAAIVAAFPNETMPPQADWMVLSALRDTENEVLDFEGTPGENLAEGSNFQELFEWHLKSNLYTNVTMDENTDLAHVKTSVLKTANNHIALRIKVAMIQPGSGNHIISLESPLVIDEVNNQVVFDYWTWGGLVTSPLPMKLADFSDNYLGAIIAKF